MKLSELIMELIAIQHQHPIDLDVEILFLPLSLPDSESIAARVEVVDFCNRTVTITCAI